MPLLSVAEYTAKTLADHGITHVFMVTGGGAMFLNVAIGSEPRISVVCTHHEQAAAMAAEGYARIEQKIGAVNVTTGPGGINALNGVFGAWTDSIPLLVISGQVKRETCMGFVDIPGLRQLGDQEVDIIRIASPITKYAATVRDPREIRKILEKALFLAVSGRPGPCWVDIPIDVQSSKVNPEELVPYNPAEDEIHFDGESISAACAQVIEKIKSSARPVVLAGTGVRISKATDLFLDVMRMLAIPVTTAWTHDIIESDDPLFCGRPGTIGTRAGNFTVQNADVLLVIGSRLNIRQVSYNWKSFAKNAYKIQVEIDPVEMHKPFVKIDLPIHCDARVFLMEMRRQLVDGNYDGSRHADWLAWCRQRMAAYPVVLQKHRQGSGKINPYHFMEVLFRHLSEEDIVVCGNATACIVPFQAAMIKAGQRMFSNSGSASMGYDLPAAIGASFAGLKRRVICLAGDGSIQQNIQELQTLKQFNLPVKIFVLNNNGYLSIRMTQKNFFGHTIGESPESGVTFPDYVRVAEAYGIRGLRIEGGDFESIVQKTLAFQGPVVAEVMLDEEQTFEPRLSSRQLTDGRIVSAELEDMFPFLDRNELKSNMLVPSESESGE